MPDMRKIECSIHTEKGKLDEYQDTKALEHPKKITRYIDISGTDGKRFWIEARALPDFEWEPANFNCLVPFVTVDGVDLMSFGSIKPSTQRTFQYHGPAFSKLVDGKYVHNVSEMFFQPLSLVEERAEDTIYESNDTRLQSLGRIEVRVRRTMGVVTDELWTGKEAMTKQLTSVHEKALKGRSGVHSVQLNGSRAHPTEKLYRVKDTYLDSMADPYITFIFLYHTRDSLKYLGLIPISASPIEISDDDGDDKIAPEPTKLKHQIEALTAQLNKKKATLKRHYGDTGDSTYLSAPIKRETKRRSAGTARTLLAKEVAGEHEVLDLTMED